jgi:hypothetical protein
MDGKIGRPLVGSSTACNLGETGKLLRAALAARSAPPDFREHLRRRLVSGWAATEPARSTHTGTNRLGK